MATTVAHLQAVLSANTRDFDRAMDRSESKTKKFGKIAGAAALGAGAAVAYGLGKVAKIGWDEFNAGQAVAAQTNAVLKSTGGVANVTAKQVDDLAVSLMKKSGVDDELIKSGSNLLLTFTNIRNETGKGNAIFDRATKTALDMSVALGQDTKSSAIQLGKALNDPIKGITALQRVGVTFTEAQREQIEALVESGDTMKAQKLILKELQKEFGGSAEAAGQTFGGQINILRERFNNWAGDMVAKAIPLLTRFGKWLMPLVEKAVEVVGDIIEDHLRPAFESIVESFRRNGPQLREIWESYIEIVKRVWKVAGPIIDFFFREIVPRAIDFAVKYIGTYIKILEKIITTAERVVKWFRGTFVEFWRNLWNGIKLTAERFWLWLQEKALETYLAIVEPFSHLPGKLGEWARDAKDKVNPELDRIRGKIATLGTEADKIHDREFTVTFTTNAAAVAANIGATLGRTARGIGDGLFGVSAVAQNPGGLNPAILDELGVAQGMGLVLSAGGGYRPGAITSTGNKSLHSVGKAIDVVGSATQMAAFFRAMVGRPGIRELLYSPIGGWYGGGGIVPLSGSVLRDHFSHVHLGIFDDAMRKARYLMPGWTLAGNFTGRPEPVGMAAGGGGTTVIVNANVIGSEREAVRWFTRAAEQMRRQGWQG